jgi:hypothetical protein
MYELRPPAPRTARGNLYPYPRVRNAPPPVYFICAPKHAPRHGARTVVRCRMRLAIHARTLVAS